MDPVFKILHQIWFVFSRACQAFAVLESTVAPLCFRANIFHRLPPVKLIRLWHWVIKLISWDWAETEVQPTQRYAKLRRRGVSKAFPTVASYKVIRSRAFDWKFLFGSYHNGFGIFRKLVNVRFPPQLAAAKTAHTNPNSPIPWCGLPPAESSIVAIKLTIGKW